MFKKSKTEILKIKNIIIVTFIYGQREYPEPDLPWPASWETYMQVRKQQLELNMEQQTGSKSGKENIKAVYCHPAYLTYMQSESKRCKWKLLSRVC